MMFGDANGDDDQGRANGFCSLLLLVCGLHVIAFPFALLSNSKVHSKMQMD
jgi:hypothetical protein